MGNSYKPGEARNVSGRELRIYIETADQLEGIMKEREDLYKDYCIWPNDIRIFVEVSDSISLENAIQFSREFWAGRREYYGQENIPRGQRTSPRIVALYPYGQAFSEEQWSNCRSNGLKLRHSIPIAPGEDKLQKYIERGMRIAARGGAPVVRQPYLPLVDEDEFKKLERQDIIARMSGNLDETTN